MDLFAKGYAFFRGGIACVYVLIQIHSLTALDVVCKIEVQNYSRGQVDYHELKVAMRALGFDVKKQEVPRVFNFGCSLIFPIAPIELESSRASMSVP